MEFPKPNPFPRTKVQDAQIDPDLEILRWLRAEVDVPSDGYIVVSVQKQVRQLLCGCSHTERVMADTLNGQQRSLFYRRADRLLQPTLIGIGSTLSIAVHADGRYNCCHCLECWHSPLYKNRQYDTGRY